MDPEESKREARKQPLDTGKRIFSVFTDIAGGNKSKEQKAKHERKHAVEVVKEIVPRKAKHILRKKRFKETDLTVGIKIKPAPKEGKRKLDRIQKNSCRKQKTSDPQGGTLKSPPCLAKNRDAKQKQRHVKEERGADVD